MRWSFVGVLAPVAVTLLSGVLFAQDEGIISGGGAEGGRPRQLDQLGHTLEVVVFLEDEPRNGMEVTLTCDPVEGGRHRPCGPPGEGVTDDDGRVSLGGLQPGAYDVLVRMRDSDIECEKTEWTGNVDVIYSYHEYLMPISCSDDPDPKRTRRQGNISWAP